MRLLNATPHGPETVAVSQLRGVGAQISRRLAKLEVYSISDLLFHLPFRYEDRTRACPIGGLVVGSKTLIEGRIELAEIMMRPRRTLVCRIGDGTGLLTLRFFYFNSAQKARLGRGARIRCFGEVRAGFNGLEMIHPEYQPVPEVGVAEDLQALTAVYRLTDGISQARMRRLVTQAIEWWKGTEGLSGLQDLLPAPLVESLGFPELEPSLAMLHEPPAEMSVEQLSAWDHPAQHRLVCEELIAHYLSLSQARMQGRKKKARVFEATGATVDRFLEALPFDLTGAQVRVIREAEDDLCSGHPMMRLVHGDVGSGKTVVAACCSLSVLVDGWQVALMAPTELLAEQHHSNFSQWLEPLGMTVGFLSGNQPEKVRKETLELIRSGSIGVVVGTHALFQQAVSFSRLGLVIIDEQHRFGVDQRLALRDKGQVDGYVPHQLVMTATPIPRTLAMLRFADLDVSVIDELPPGRKPVKTSVIPASRREEVIDRISAWIAGGRQAYWVCTLIEESDFLQCEAAEKTATNLGKALSGIRVGLVHGRMPAMEKDAVMQSFKQHRYDLLVATTVIEVGVDVANADLMVIENPERLGLAQLHQLRGRVGRGAGNGFCLLMYQSPLSSLAKERLSMLRETTDGFRIAEKDLELRGPGDVMGTRQTGQIQFRLADLGRDRNLLELAVAAARRIQTEFPEYVQPLIQRWVGGGARYANV